jgi:Xaa-Pro dipeptidase
VTGDLVSGRERTSTFGGWPIGRIVEFGDPVIVDLAPRVGGYWGDSCAAMTVGAPSPAFQALFDAVKSALDLALDLIRPGLACADLHGAIKNHIEARGYTIGHHSGHSIGTAVHEWPRLVPFEREPLRSGMVIMVEPNALDPAVGAARVEWMVEVTDTGSRVLTDFEHVSGAG